MVCNPTWWAIVHGDCNIALTVSKMSKCDYWADPTWWCMVHGDCNITLTVSKISKCDYWADQSDSKNQNGDQLEHIQSSQGQHLLLKTHDK